MKARAADLPASTQEALASPDVAAGIQSEAQHAQYEVSSSGADEEHVQLDDEDDGVNQAASYTDIDQEAATDDGSKSSYEVHPSVS